MNKDYLITKSNTLIYSRYDLSLEEQRVILTVASLVQPEDISFKAYSIKINEFANLIGVEANNRYTKLRKTTKTLMSKTLEIETDNEYLQVNWLSSCKYLKKQGIIEVKFSDELKPYLLKLKEKFTTYHLRNILSMKTKYSIRMYEILKSNQFRSSITIEIDEIRKLLKCENYKNWINLKQRVIEPSIKEINAFTDLYVDYEQIKKGRSIVALEFTIKKSSSDMNLYSKDTLLSSTEELELYA